MITASYKAGTVRSVTVVLRPYQMEGREGIQGTLERMDKALGVERKSATLPGNRLMMSWEGAPEHMKQSVKSFRRPQN